MNIRDQSTKNILFSGVVAIVIILIVGSKLPVNTVQPRQVSRDGENSVIKQGVNIQLTLDPFNQEHDSSAALLENENARVRFTLQDATTQEPIKGLHPMAWLDREMDSEKDLSCKDRVNSYLQGKLAFQPEVNLNSYYVLTLNNKASISVIDPLGGYGSSKMITRILLKSPGSDWVLSKDGKRLYVATPLSRQVAVIDTSVWKVTRFLDFPSEPTRLALQPDEHYLWIGLNPKLGTGGFAGAIVIDTEKLEMAAELATGAGTHHFSFSEGNRYAYVGNGDDRSVSIIDIGKLALIKNIALDSKPVGLAFSNLAKALYVIDAKGAMTAIGEDSQAIDNRIDLDSPLHALKFTPDGRWGFIVSPGSNRVFMIDASVNRLVQSLEVGMAPDQISFSETFAYIRSRDSEMVSMIRLDSLARGELLSATTFPGGQQAPGLAKNLPDADAIVPTPERNAVLVANPGDKTVYYYMEGMAAPMGSFKNFGLEPMAVLVVDKSLQETAPGVYEGSVQLPPSGSYVVPVLLNNPTVFHCFSAEVKANPKKQTAAPEKAGSLEFLVDTRTISVGDKVRIRLRVGRPSGVQKSVSDLQILTFLIPGTWQKRFIAEQVADDIYQIEFTPPQVGSYRIHVQSPSLRVDYENGPNITLQAVKGETGNKS